MIFELVLYAIAIWTIIGWVAFFVSGLLNKKVLAAPWIIVPAQLMIWGFKLDSYLDKRS